MKIILTENVKGLGKAGDLAEAKTGYAHNYLFRNKLAIPASEENLKKWEEEQKILKEEERKNREKANELKERIENITLKLKVKAGDNGKVFRLNYDYGYCKRTENTRKNRFRQEKNRN